jgi:hypothetical protein
MGLEGGRSGLERCALVCVTEMKSKEDIDRLARAVREAVS